MSVLEPHFSPLYKAWSASHPSRHRRKVICEKETCRQEMKLENRSVPLSSASCSCFLRFSFSPNFMTLSLGSLCYSIRPSRFPNSKSQVLKVCWPPRDRLTLDQVSFPGPVTWSLEELGEGSRATWLGSQPPRPALSVSSCGARPSCSRNIFKQTSLAQAPGECGGILGSTSNLRLCSIRPSSKLLFLRHLQPESWGHVIREALVMI